MSSIFVLTMEQMFTLFLFIIIGYVLRKKKIVPKTSTTIVSKILLWVFMPMLCLRTFIMNCSVDNLSSNITIFAAGVAVIAIAMVIAIILGKRFGTDQNTTAIYQYSFAISNLGYMGYPIMQAVFGEEMLFNMMLFCIPMNFVLYSWGSAVLIGNGKLKIKQVFNAPMIAMLAGIIIGLIGIPVPEFILNALKTGGDCMAPSAMLLAGMVAAGADLKEVFNKPKIYIASFIRLVILPLLFGTAMYLLKMDRTIIIATVVTLAMPFGLNTIILPEAAGKDSSVGASTCIVCNLMAIITIPLMMMLLTLI